MNRGDNCTSETFSPRTGRVRKNRAAVPSDSLVCKSRRGKNRPRRNEFTKGSGKTRKVGKKPGEELQTGQKIKGDGPRNLYSGPLYLLIQFFDNGLLNEGQHFLY